MKIKEYFEKKKTDIYKIIVLVLVVVLAVCVIILVKEYVDRKNAEDYYRELAKSINTGTEKNVNVEIPKDTQVVLETETESSQPVQNEPAVENQIEIPEKNLDWNKIFAANSDIYAWLYIPGTKIDYPIFQSATDDEYYLNHNMDGSEGYPGCIYTEMANDKEFKSFNTVLYGHNMKNGTMFHSLHDYLKDEKYFEQNRYAYIYLPDGRKFAYEIFAAYVFTDQHLLNTFNYETETDREDYLKTVFSYDNDSANFRKNVNVTGKNHILTMSTCITGKPSNRVIVQGVLVNDSNLITDR